MTEANIKIGDLFVSLFVLSLSSVKLIVFIFYLESIDFPRFFSVSRSKYWQVVKLKNWPLSLRFAFIKVVKLFTMES